MKYDKEAIKQFVKEYHNTTTIDVKESELDIDNFFEISDDVITVDEIEKEILRCIKEDRNNA